jgi:predicted transcriptional regulator
MARKKTPTLTDGEMKIMKIIWQLGEASVSDVVKRQDNKNKIAYNTILTMMRIMERKGYISHKKKGKAHIFMPTISTSQARIKAIKHMVDSFFNGSPELLVQSLVENKNISIDDIDRIKKMIDKNRG